MKFTALEYYFDQKECHPNKYYLSKSLVNISGLLKVILCQCMEMYLSIKCKPVNLHVCAYVCTVYCIHGPTD